MNEAIYDPYEELDEAQNTAVPLSRYAHIIGYDECAFWGVVHSGQSFEPWTEYQRRQMAQALAEAQHDMEGVIGYPLAPTFVVGTLAEERNGDLRLVDDQTYRGVQLARYGHVLAVGAPLRAMIEAGATVDTTNDPAVVGPFPTNATQAWEVKVYYPGGARAIQPSRVTLSGGMVTVEIPRCRLVRAGLLSNPRSGWMYEEDDNFLATVDLAEERVDPSRQAVLVRSNCGVSECSGGCGECTQDACAYVKDHEAGIVSVMPGVYADGTWSPRTATRRYDRVRLYYVAGQRRLAPRAESALVRLAHSKAPEAPCGDASVEHLWRRDRHVPDLLTRERLNCAFGLSDGAWSAYQTALRLKLWRMGTTETA